MLTCDGTQTADCRWNRLGVPEAARSILIVEDPGRPRRDSSSSTWAPSPTRRSELRDSAKGIPPEGEVKAHSRRSSPRPQGRVTSAVGHRRSLPAQRPPIATSSSSTRSTRVRPGSRGLRVSVDCFRT